MAGSKKGRKQCEGRFRANVKSAGNVVHIDPDAVFSIHHVKTGESANVYWAEDYLGVNPIYFVKGTDKNGNEYEQMVDVSKVNPNSCYYTKMLALNAHTGNKSDSNFMTMSILKDKMDGTSLLRKSGLYAHGCISLISYSLTRLGGHPRFSGRLWNRGAGGMESARIYCKRGRSGSD